MRQPTSSLFTLHSSLLLLLLLLCACSGTGDKAVPRREGYPRVEMAAPTYAAVQGLPLVLEVNEQAQLSQRTTADGSVWLDCQYPSLKATAYYTFTPVNGTTVADVVSNRIERIMLNLGGLESDVEEFTSIGGAPITLISAQGVVSTPVQFIATTPLWVASGSLFLSDITPTTPFDSIAPIITTLHDDIAQTLFSLRPPSDQ